MKVRKKTESSDSYHASKPISRSKLFRIMKNGQLCPQNYKYLLENPPEETEALLFGRAFHKFVLEHDGFENEFAVAPVCDRRTSAGKSQWNDFVESAQGKSVITSEMFDSIFGMAESIKNNPYAKLLISGEAEKSYYWTDEITGLKCKCRPDVITKIGDKNVIVDLKSTNNASTDAFQRDCIKLGYDLQVAMYKQGVDAYYKKPYGFVFIAVEKTAPYALNILEADEHFVEKGQALFRELLGELKYCQDTNDWYGYGGAAEIGGINSLTLPAYMLKDFS